MKSTKELYENITISVATIPRRFDFFTKTMLPTLTKTLEEANRILRAKKEEFVFDKILVNVDDNISEEDYTNYKELERSFCEGFPGVEVQKNDSRYRCISKEAGPIIKYGYDTTFITVDDDQIYNDVDKFLDLIKFHKQFPNEVICVEANPVVLSKTLDNKIVLNILNTLVFKVAALKSYSKILSNFCLFTHNCFENTRLLDIEYIVKEEWNRHDELFCWCELTRKGVKNITINNTYSLAWDNFDTDFTGDEKGLRDYNSVHWNDWTVKVNSLYNDLLSKIKLENYEYIIEDKNAYAVGVMKQNGVMNTFAAKYGKILTYNTDMLHSKSYEKYMFRN